MLQCVLQCFAVFCSALQCVTVCCSVLQCVLRVSYNVLQCVAACCSVLQRAAEAAVPLARATRCKKNSNFIDLSHDAKIIHLILVC